MDERKGKEELRRPWMKGKYEFKITVDDTGRVMGCENGGEPKHMGDILEDKQRAGAVVHWEDSSKKRVRPFRRGSAALGWILAHHFGLFEDPEALWDESGASEKSG